VDGRLPPLGYDKEAETVRHIFRRYADLGSVRALEDELQADGIVSKRRVDRFGRACGGKPLARGALYLMLQNRIYRGEIAHKGASYPGEQEAIIDAVLWGAVQARLAENRVARNTGAKAAEPSLLAGLVYDDVGERMTPTHANKKGTRYRYYVSHNLIRRGRPKGGDAGRRVPAGDLENLIEDRILAFLGDAAAIFSAIAPFSENVNQGKAVVRKAAELAERWAELDPPARRIILKHLVSRIDVRRDAVDIAIRQDAIARVAECDLDPTRAHAGNDDAPTLILSIPARLQRAGLETRLLIEGAGCGLRREPDRSLLRLLARAHRFHAMVMEDQSKSITELAGDAGVSPSYFTRILMAEGVGFEPTRRSPACRFSRPVPSTTRPPLRLAAKMAHCRPACKVIAAELSGEPSRLRRVREHMPVFRAAPSRRPGEAVRHPPSP
jgi:site-specific DNA recombinase